MGWQLAPQVSFCWAQDQAIFLDVTRDRYFALPAKANQAFAIWAEDRVGDPPEMLVRHRLLIECPSRGTEIRQCTVAKPERSIPIGPPQKQDARFDVAAQAFVAIWRARLRHRRSSLQASLLRVERLRAQRRSAAAEPDPVALARRFAQVRAWQPLSASCLPDSLALVEFLARRGHAPMLVFGVTARPFAAHCWVQTPDRLLNEVPDVASRFTPIHVL